MIRQLSKELQDKITEYIKDWPLEFDWSREGLSKEDILKISEKGIDEFSNDLWEMNIDYIAEMEISLMHNIQDEFWEELDNEIGEEFDLYELRDYFMDYITVDMNIDKLLSQTDVMVLFKFYSNYDSTDYGDNIEDEETYLGDIYKRVSGIVKQEDFLSERHNTGTGNVFCLATRMEFGDFLKLKEKWDDTKKLFVAKGTQYGFFNSFDGSGSQFEHETSADGILPIKLTDYDEIGMRLDFEQYPYTMQDTYGTTSFINSNNISITD